MASKEYNKKYNQEHKKERREYSQSPEGRKNLKKAQDKYSHSLKGKETKKSYQKEYFQSPKWKESKKKQNALRKQFGFIPLNQFFEGSEGHHVDTERVIYIPKKLHRSIWHSQNSGVGMSEINELAFGYLELENRLKNRPK